MSSEQIRPNLLTVVPGNINIENFVPGRVYKETLMIYNTCNVPIVLNLKTSDKNKLTISESKMRIGVNQSKKLDLIIQDKLNYKYAKTPVKQKQLFIHMKGDLIDEKYEINLIYYQKNSHKNNIYNNISRNQNNPNLINNRGMDILNKNIINNEIPNGYLTENPNNHLIYENIDNKPNRPNNYQTNYYEEYGGVPLQNKNYSIPQNQGSYMSIEKNDSQEIIALKNIINDLLNKINNLTPLLNHHKSSKLYNDNQLGVCHNCFYIFGNDCEKEIYDKYKLDQNIDNERLLSRNKILELENTTLLYRIKCLEKKLSLYENKNEDEKMSEHKLNDNNNIYKNKIDIMKDNNLDNYNNYIKNKVNDKYLNDIDVNKNEINNYLYKNIHSKNLINKKWEKSMGESNENKSIYPMKNESEFVYNKKISN